MTVTFQLNNTPYVKERITESDGETWDDMVPAPGWFALNMHNTAAADLLLLLDRPTDAKKLYGSWDLETVGVILRRLVKLRNMQSKSFEKAPEIDGNFVECGRDADYVDHRLNTMNLLLRSAIERKLTVTFG